jgi:hypothetical protein
MKTTLNEIKSHSPCEEGWDKALEIAKAGGISHGQEIDLLDILDAVGVSDTLWVIFNINPHDDFKLLLCDFAKHVLPIYENKYPGDGRVRDCISVTRDYIKGRATRDELIVAQEVAVDAADNADAVADADADAVADAAAVADNADNADNADDADEREWQAEQLRKLLEKH